MNKTTQLNYNFSIHGHLYHLSNLMFHFHSQNIFQINRQVIFISFDGVTTNMLEKLQQTFEVTSNCLTIFSKNTNWFELKLTNFDIHSVMLLPSQFHENPVYLL